MSSTEADTFIQHLSAFFAAQRRDMPWRELAPSGTIDPYHILVSEIMLQQTQVPRVIPKYEQFLVRFPSPRDLAEAPLADVLTVWQGLGYNRRAKFLWQAAQMIVQDFAGTVPTEIEELVKLPGVGRNTAGAVMAYAYDVPVVFVETNIRTVFIHHFFADTAEVHDKDILELVCTTLPQDESLTRAWYWALMDYGSHLKQEIGNLNKLSKHYVKQSTFHGSKRQIRGAIIRVLSNAPAPLLYLQQTIPDERLEGVLLELEQEGLVHSRGGVFTL